MKNKKRARRSACAAAAVVLALLLAWGGIPVSALADMLEEVNNTTEAVELVDETGGDAAAVLGVEEGVGIASDDEAVSVEEEQEDAYAPIMENSAYENVLLQTQGAVTHTATAVSLGYCHSAAIAEDGSLWTWGWNNFGELGDGTTTLRTAPIKVMSGVASVCTAESHTAAIKTDGSLWTWGSNWAGQLGLGTISDSRHPTPTKLMDGVMSVCMGHAHCAAVKTDGSLWTWGWNKKGELGDGTTEDRTVPKKIMDNVVTISLGNSHSAAIKTDGSLWTWGYNEYGQLGDGTTNDKSVPTKVMDGVVAISLGTYHSAALKADGSLWMWGNNRSGQLGDGTTNDKSVPTKVMDGVTSVVLGDYHSAAMRADGKILTWGWNYRGQLGNGTTEDVVNPTAIKIEEVFTTSLSGASISVANQTYTGKALTPAPTVRLGGKVLKAGTDYTVAYQSNVSAGTATVTVTGRGDYSGSRSATFKIAKATNPMTVKANKKTVKLAKLKKKAQAVASLKVTGAKGKVSYARVAKGSAKCLSVNKKNGKVSVKKGTKKGTYKVKVKVTAAGDANHKAGSKTITCKVVVK